MDTEAAAARAGGGQRVSCGAPCGGQRRPTGEQQWRVRRPETVGRRAKALERAACSRKLR
ncbi:hypothetical protein C2845_PM05G09000 [Panicum miliaceum]|uniref:Uncharacterized protein n=1 Tax=Panicum miliaceum TaxID=4540 RepID=A0A3L6SXI3_PANMI|nr:hypothetical protein C2845_PM05G09000 [Panicum miliaceum]